MPLTHDFQARIRDRMRQDIEFAEEMFRCAIEDLLSGELEPAKEVLRDYINSTIGFESLARETGLNAKSLMRMFSKSGNPTARNLMAVISTLQKKSGKQIHLQMTG